MGKKEAELASTKEELAEAKAQVEININEIKNLRKRKEKSGTLLIVKNLEQKTAKLANSKHKLTAEVATLNGTVDDLETELMKKNEEVLILVKKEKVAKQSIRHLQKDLLSATAKLKTARGEISKLKVGGDLTAVPVEKAENSEGSSCG